MTFVTFVTPTLWRPSLQTALDSLEAQTDSDWQSVVYGDGNGPDWPDEPAYIRNRVEHFRESGRFHFMWSGPFGSAGVTRNHGIRVARTAYPARWYAWLDDDDMLDPGYVAALRDHDHMMEPDVVVFTMDDPRLGYIPPKGWTGGLHHSLVGISFAVRDHILPVDPFIREDLKNPGEFGNEDINLLTRLEREGAMICMSPEVRYIVRPSEKR